ncbi:MAG: hypothetical protein WB646_03240 [Steroidobacteraceae bacterium]
MSETIRQSIRRRTLTRVAIGVALWLVFAVIPFFVIPQFATSQYALPAVIAGAICFMVGLFLARHIRCPRCARQIGRTIGLLVAFSSAQRGPRQCPYCHADLDQPMG